MVLDRVDEYGSVWAVAQAPGPKLGVGSSTLGKWVLQAQTDAGAQYGTSSEEGAEIKRLNKVSFALGDCRHLTRRPETDLLAASCRVVRSPTIPMAGAPRATRELGKC